MATIMLEGFDKYGPPYVAIPDLETSLNSGGWSYITVYTNPAIVSSLGGVSDYAVQLSGVSLFLAPIAKTLPANYSRLIGGFRFSANLLHSTGLMFIDGSTTQCSIKIDYISGFISICEGENGTVLATSSASVAANTVHYLEFDVTFGSPGGWTIWLDGVQILSGTGLTRQSGNSYANVFAFTTFGDGIGGTPIITVDDFYLFDSTTAFNNTVLLSNPYVLTQFPLGDHQTQFSNGGNVFGNTYSCLIPSFGLTTYTTGADKLYLAQFTPNVNCTLNDVVINIGTTSPGNASTNMKGVVYSDLAGVPNTLLSSGTQVTGYTTGQQVQLPLVAPQALTAGTPYWLGLISDLGATLQDFITGVTTGYVASNTYSGGAPGTAPAMTANQASVYMFGLCSGAATNWESEALDPPIGDLSYVSSATVNIADLYTFPALPANVQQVYTVGIEGHCRITVAGTHTFDLVMSSGGTSSNGTNAPITPTLNYAWYKTHFDTDPHTSAAWTAIAVANSYCGPKVVS